ncbi:hypothetical protein VULLAG_LOCUS19449 [Vulpes lagopus]
MKQKTRHHFLRDPELQCSVLRWTNRGKTGLRKLIWPSPKPYLHPSDDVTQGLSVSSDVHHTKARRGSLAA